VVATEVVTLEVVTDVVTEVEVKAFVVVEVALVVVDAEVVFVVLVEHDASTIATTTKKLKPNQIYLCFTGLLLFI
jgi:hypothetical protein